MGAGLGLGHVAVELFLTCSTRHVAAPADWAAASPSAAEKAMAAHTPDGFRPAYAIPLSQSRSCRTRCPSRDRPARGVPVQDPRAVRTSPSVSRPSANRSAACAAPISLPSGERPVIVRRRFPRAVQVAAFTLLANSSHWLCHPSLRSRRRTGEAYARALRRGGAVRTQCRHSRAALVVLAFAGMTLLGLGNVGGPRRSTHRRRRGPLWIPDGLQADREAHRPNLPSTRPCARGQRIPRRHALAVPRLLSAQLGPLQGEDEPGAR